MLSKRSIESESNDSGKKTKLTISSENLETLSLPGNAISVLETQSNNKRCNIVDSGKQKQSHISDAYKCKYCWEQYFSAVCLFYTKREPGFKDELRICDCCSSDEDEGGEGSSGNCGGDSLDEKPNDLQKVTINPGWYGKGLRKNRKKR